MAWYVSADTFGHVFSLLEYMNIEYIRFGHLCDVCAFICLVSGYILLVAGRFMHVREAVGLGKVCLIKNKSHTYVFLLNNYVNKNTS